MKSTLLRAAIVGASSLAGKELADELLRSGGVAWNLTLLDETETAGQMTAAGDEAMVTQPLTPDSFTGADVVFFADDAELARKYRRQAVAANAAVVDLTAGLAQESVAVRAPLLSSSGLANERLDLVTEAVVAAHAVSLMLAYVCARLQARWGEGVSLSASVLMPASEHGKEGMDELHAQTVALLSFQTVPKDVYDTQVAFNVNTGFGPAARVDLNRVSDRIGGELRSLLGTQAAAGCAFQCVQAPVFHGCSASVYLRFQEPADVAAVRDVLSHETLLTVVDEAEAQPNGATASESDAMQASLRAEAGLDGKGVWVWLVADNLRLTARNAVACAAELLAIRPAAGVVQ